MAKEIEMEISSGLPELYTGMRVEVLTEVNRLIFVGRLELLREDLFQITEENGQNVPWVEYNTKVKLRGFQHGGEPFSMYGSVCGSSAKFWRIDRPETLQKAEQRKYYRQTMTLPATVICINQLFATEGRAGGASAEHFPCTVLDLSGGGVRLRCDKAAPFEVGDMLFILLDDPQKSGGRMTYTCCVRRATEEKGSGEYGCEFEGLTETEQDRLLQLVMAAQQQELRARRRSETY